jgi:lysophospholipase L1-like esterase
MAPHAGRRAAIALAAAAACSAHAADHWLGAWGFPPIPQPPPAAAPPAAAPAAGQPAAVPRGPPPLANLNGVTVRQLVRIAAPAARLQIRVSNEFGDQPLKVGAVHVALAAADGAIVPGSDHALTFFHAPAVAIAANAPMLSDPIDWQLPALSRLAVSLYIAGNSAAPAHRVAEWVSAPGDYTDAERLPGSTLVRGGALVSEVQIVSPAARRVVVALGDSITEGARSTVNEFRSWPDRLAERLNANPTTRSWSVVNAGIGSNRLLHNGPGSGALARFDRDVLSVPGVSMVILLEGINDIGYSHTTPAEAVGADDIIGAYVQLIERAHEHGLIIVGCTIPPFEDSHYYEAQGDVLRQSVNHWIRSSGTFDAVVDFDAVIRDPDHPSRMTPALQSGDHLHPNDAGYAAMAQAIDLKLFARKEP